jgi:cellulose synthase/poly-beta-1,6-N-acetylglucosamine synthase-like glycosyltransferase
MLLIFTIILLLAYFLLFGYYAKGWKRSKTGNSKAPPPNTLVSVIIAARNEADNIPALLNSLDLQDYPREYYEVIIVDDHSTDETKNRILSAENTNVKYVAQENGIFSKKKAIEKGISLSQGELIITTDADCILPPRWLSSLAGLYAENKAAFIAAPVKFTYGNNFLQKFQAIDFMMLQGITASGIALSLHYMCNGANLGFSKQAFQEADGYKGIDNIATGDDMLLMHKIKKLYPGSIYYLKDNDAIVSTIPMPSWKEFFMQRKRWASKTFVYDDWRIIAILAFVYFFNTWFLVLLFSGILAPVYLIAAIAYLLIKASAEWNYLQPIARFYNEEKLLKYLFLYQPIHIFYTVFIGAWSQFGNYEWKGRSTK